MKWLFLYLLSLILLQGACKKKPPDYTAYAKNNEFKATVLFSSGKTVMINGKGTDAEMGCGLLGGGTFIEGVDPSKAAVYISVSDNNFMCVRDTGSYSFHCRYEPDIRTAAIPAYSNYLSADKKGITFTQLDERHMEGHFSAVCTYGSDSVIVSGTFKGNTQ